MYKLPELTYSYDALEPSISRATMELHHSRHHQTYVDNLNKALSSREDSLVDVDVVELLKSLGRGEISKDIATSVRNNGGGHYNHSLFWKCLVPNGSSMSKSLEKAVIDRYDSVDGLEEEIKSKALGLFGSGWIWIMPDLSIITTANQDNPVMFGHDEPLAGIDVWEHAYYLDYKNARADYIDNLLKVVNWEFISDRYDLIHKED